MAILKYAAALLPILIRAAPQSAINDIPSCAYPPLLAALSGTSCASTDIACICAQTGLIPTITSTVVNACPGTVSADDVAAFIAELCGGSAASSVSESVAESVTSAVVTMTGSMELPTTAANATTTGAMPTTNGTVSSEPTVTPTTQPSGGGAEGVRMSLMAGVVAFGGLTWAFAEL